MPDYFQFTDTNKRNIFQEEGKKYPYFNIILKVEKQNITASKFKFVNAKIFSNIF